MYYIGIHSTSNIEDGYMGSGSLLKREIKKYGEESFSREILHNFSDRQSALQKEKEIVCIDVLKDLTCYNLVLGGGGIRTISEKRALFSPSAPSIKTILFEPYSKKYKVIFTPNKKNCEDFKCKIDRYVNTFTIKLARVLVDLIPKTAEDLTEQFNNKYTNEVARKTLDLFRIKGWDNLIETKHHEIS